MAACSDSLRGSGACSSSAKALENFALSQPQPNAMAPSASARGVSAPMRQAMEARIRIAS